MSLPAVSVLPERAVATEADSGRTSLRLLLTPTTVLVWVTFFCTMAAFYFIVSWTPRLLNAAGLTATQGLTGAYC